jgi:hypothetical protein
MDRVLAGLFVVAAGCASPAPARLVGPDAVLSGVSFDQKWVAVLTGARRLGTGAHIGTLELVPAAGGAATVLGTRSSGGVFNRGTTLWYLADVDVVSEGTPPSAHLYGALYVWTPQLAAPVKLGSDVREFYVSQDGTTCLFIDWAKPTTDPTNTGTLAIVHAPSCGAVTCDAIVVAENTTLAATGWHLGNDGNHVLVTVRGPATTDPGQVFLISPATRDVQILSTGLDPRSPMMTPAGDTVAWVEGDNQIHVVGAAGATVIAPEAPLVDAAVMIDAGTFIAKTRASATDPAALSKVTADVTMPLPVQQPQEFYVSQAVAGQTNRYVFFSLATIAANGEPDLWMLDHTKLGAPVQLAAAVESPIGGALSFSDDGTTIEYFDNYNPVTRRGDAYVVPLATPARTLVATGVHNAAFIPGTTRLLYINAPDATTGAGVLTVLPSPTALAEIQGVGTVNFADTRQGPARTWFTQTTGAPDDGVWSMPQP